MTSEPGERNRGVRTGSDLARRLVVAAIGIPAGVGIIYLGGWILGIVIALVATLCLHEFYRFSALSGARPLGWMGLPAAAGLVLLAVLLPDVARLAPWALGLVVLLALAALGTAVWSRWPGGRPLASASATVTGVLYTGGALAFAPLLRGLPEGRGVDDPWTGALLLIFPLTMTWAGDSGAFFAGKRWGRRRLIPRVSPGKTVVGSVAGLLVAAATGAVFAELLLAGRPPVSVSAAGGAALGLAVGAAGQVGDLAASVLKREAGVKDSGRLLPGHGGAIDRFDAVLFTLPLTYLLLAAGERLFL